MEAEAIGVSSNSENNSSSGCPSSISTSFCMHSCESAGVAAWSCFSSSARSRPTRSGRVLRSCPSLMKVGPRSVSVRRMRASRVRRAIASPARELRRSLAKSMFVWASQSARPYLLSVATISVPRFTLRYRCGMARTLITMYLACDFWAEPTINLILLVGCCRGAAVGHFSHVQWRIAGFAAPGSCGTLRATNAFALVPEAPSPSICAPSPSSRTKLRFGATLSRWERDFVSCGMAWRELYPFESRFLELSGARMHYVEEGAGEPLLFVHGNPTWSFYWRNLILGLRGQFRCVAVDHVGCGLSDKPRDYPYTLAQRIEDLASFVQRLDLSGMTLVAHDWGGAIGLGTVLQLRERFSRIVLFNTGAFPPPFVPWRIAACRLPALGTLAVRGLNAFARAALTMAVEKRERMTADVRAGLLAPYDCWDNRVAVDRFVKDIPFSQRHPTWQLLEAVEAGLASLAELPIQVIWGMRDWCFRPECLERFLKYWPQAEVHHLADCGHYVVEDAHERIVPLLKDYLARTEPRSAAIPHSALRTPR